MGLAVDSPEIPNEIPEVVYQIGGSLIAAAFVIFGWRMLNAQGRTVLIVLALVWVGYVIFKNS